MKLSEYQRSTSSFDLGQRSLRFQSYMFDFGLYTQVSDSGPWALLFKFALKYVLSLVSLDVDRDLS